MTDNTPTSQEYFADVAEIAKEALRQEREEGADAYDALHEGVDGTQWVIYYWRQALVLQFSSNEDAMFDAGADLSSCKSWGEATQVAAFYAMLADAQEALEELRGQQEEEEEVQQ